VLGRHVAEFSSPQFRRFTMLRRFAPALRGKPVHDVVAAHRGGDGRIVHVTVSVLPTLGPDGRVTSMLGVCSDITALKRREAELDIALRNQQAIFDAAGEGIVFVRGGRIESANRALAKMLGVTRGYLIGQPAAELLAQVSEWNAIQRGAREAAVRGEASIHELLLRARDGRSVWCQLTAREVEASTMIMVLTDITVLKRREELAWHQANHDELTGLPNRRSLAEHARRLLSVVIRQKRQAAVMVLDLDGFKDVNDAFGHAFGDALLRRVALRLSAVLREYDVLARTGGDEFVVLLPEVEGLGGVRAVAQKLVAAAGEDLETAGRLLPIRASVGVAVFPDDGEDFDGLLLRADAAMYAAKAGGKNQYRLAFDLPLESRSAQA
jgi:diguanylate cyclase (GGDEF)-like protein/PAS domain S-box-containing protein